MSLFNLFDRTNGGNVPATPNTASQPSQASAPPPKKARRRTGRTAIYSVRVGTGFKGEILALMSELQREQSAAQGKPRHITEGEVIEQALEALHRSRARTPAASVKNIVYSAEVLEGLDIIARAENKMPAQVIEELVVRRVEKLSLLPRINSQTR